MIDVKTAVCQIKPVRDKKRSIDKAIGMISRAADAGADLIVLPELFYHPYELKLVPELEESDEETIEIIRETARSLKVVICAGTVIAREGDRRLNKSYVINGDGEVILEYAKCHLFDVNIPGVRVQESAFFNPGDQLRTADAPFGRIGVLVCYDIRFPEMARALAVAGVEILLVPAAFAVKTGAAHWSMLLRSRAVENQMFVVAASPARDQDAAFQAYGHSMMVDPWGDVLVEAGEDETIIHADLKAERLEDTRRRLPLLRDRRPEVYEAEINP